MATREAPRPMFRRNALRSEALAALSLVPEAGLGTLVEQGRGVPWGGVLTVLGNALQALLP